MLRLNAMSQRTVIRPITAQLLNDLLDAAARNPRRRVPYRFHEHEEPVQRMLNAILPGSYITPHKHENPDKVELIAILTGKAAVVHFSENGGVQAVFILEPDGAVRGVDMPPRVYHNFVALTPCVVLEIVQGPYHPDTHKQFAPWAPTEDTPETVQFLAQLESYIRALEATV
jgi:cupin fold WbuC family metalloprotein